eukprot:627286-Amphidinium_carterae.1
MVALLGAEVVVSAALMSRFHRGRSVTMRTTHGTARGVCLWVTAAAACRRAWSVMRMEAMAFSALA